MKLVHFVLKNSMLMNLLTVMILVIGSWRASTIQREAMPSVDFDLALVTTYYPGASPREVEQYITEILEEQIEQVEGIDEFNSVSIEGFSLVTVKLDINRSENQKNKTINEIQRAIDRAKDLPDDLLNPPLVATIESEKFPVVDVSLHGDVSYDRLYDLADQLKDKLEALPDIDNVDWRAKREREYWVEIDPGKLYHWNLGLGEVINALRTRNINLPGGAIETNGTEVLVRTIGEAQDVTEIADIVLRTNAAGFSVRLKDIANVRETFEESNRQNRTNGDPAIMLSVIIDSEQGDILNAVKDAREVTDLFLEELNDPTIHVAYVNDMSYFVRNRLGVLMNNGKAGIALVLIILLLFLSKGIAIVTAIGLPVAFLGTILVMSMTGLSINLLTMFALIIVLGMVVDDAIIVGENIWQHYENGATPFDAALFGTAEVIKPVTATILTTMAAFSPMLFVSGIFGKFMFSMPVVVMITLSVSLLEAMFVLPSHAYDMLKLASWRDKKKGIDRSSGHQQQGGRLLKPMLDSYVWGLDLVLKLRYLFLAGIIALLVFSLNFSKQNMNTVLFPSSGIEVFFVRATLPAGTPIEDTEAALVPIEKLISTLPELELQDHITNLGIQQNDPNNDPFTKRGSHLGQVLVFLTPELDRVRTADEIIESIRTDMEKIAQKHKYVSWNFDRMKPGPPVGKPVAIRVMGDDLAQLKEVADKALEYLKTQAGVKDAAVDFTPGKDEIQVIVDDDRARQALLTVDNISRHILASFEGQIASHVRAEGERIPIRVRFDETARDDLQSLQNLEIPNSRGILVPLKDVSTFERAEGILQITRREGVRIITVTSNIDEKQTSSTRINTNIAPFLKNLEKDNPGVSISAGGEFEDTQESLDSLLQAFVFAMGTIFIILAAQFGSLTQPFVVMSAIPFGIIGVIWAFYILGLPLSFLGFIGIIGLSGVVINDSIVLVSFINNSRADGMGPKEAALHAGRRRFRAVWLTTLTTVFGLLPMVYGWGGMDKFLQPAAVALGYGLIFGTVLVLLFVPAMYMIRIDIGNGLRWIFRLNPQK